MDVHEGVLGHTGHQHRGHALGPVEPLDQLRHPRRHLCGGRRGVDDLTRHHVAHVVLDGAVLAGLQRPAAYVLYQDAVDLLDEALGEVRKLPQVVGHEVHGLPVVQQLLAVVPVHALHLLTGQDELRLGEGDSGALDVGRVVGLQHHGIHPLVLQPLLLEVGGVQEAAGPLNLQ